MKLNGAIIIVGSLFWDNKTNRSSWRKRCLKPLKASKSVILPIRYGRKSSTRFHTYTMIFSNNVSNELSKGKLISLKKNINSFEDLEIQAIELAIAEGIYTDKNRRLTTTWGSIGLLFNPKLKINQETIYYYFKSKWIDIYNKYQNTFNSNLYKTDLSESQSITQNGFLNINWANEMDEYDLLLATPVIPSPNKYLTPNEIATQMIENDYFEYFDKNRKNKITTLDDEEIIKIIATKKAN